MTPNVSLSNAINLHTRLFSDLQKIHDVCNQDTWAKELKKLRRQFKFEFSVDELVKRLKQEAHEQGA